MELKESSLSQVVLWKWDSHKYLNYKLVSKIIINALSSHLLMSMLSCGAALIEEANRPLSPALT